MIKKLNINNHIILYLFFASLVFFTQASSLNKEVIDWDESTYAIIANNLVNGNNLYVDVWEGKPPVLFYWIAFFIKMFGANIFAVRIAGDVLIYLTVVFLFKILQDSYDSVYLSIIGCTFFIFLFNFNFAQPTLSELPGLLFITFSIYIHRFYPKKTLLNGLVVGLAIMSRTNLGFLIFGFLIIYLREKYSIKKNFLFLIGSSTPFILFGAYFYFKNAFLNYLSGVFIEITYSSSTNKISDFYNDVLVDKIENLDLREIIFVFIVLITFYIGYKKNFTLNLSNEIILLVTLLISIFLGRSFFYHYIIQIYSLLTLFVVEVIFLLKLKKINLFVIIFLILIQGNLVFLGFNNIYNYQQISNNYPIKKIAKKLDSKQYLAITNHLVYFYNQNESPVVVHPGLYNNEKKFKNLFENLISIGIINENERKLALLSKPEFILCDEICNDILDVDYLKNYYVYQEYLDTIVYKLK